MPSSDFALSVLKVKFISETTALNEHAQCTPNQPIKDVYDFDTPTKETTNENTVLQNDNLGRKPKKKVDKKKNKKDAVGKSESTSKTNQNPDNKEMKGQKRVPLSKGRKNVPQDQSTMTQFYDYDGDSDKNNESCDVADAGEQHFQSGYDDPQLENNAKSSQNDTLGGMSNVLAEPKYNHVHKHEKQRTGTFEEKKKKAAEITDIRKATTRLRHKENVPVTNAEDTSWFDDVNGRDKSDISRKSEVDLPSGKEELIRPPESENVRSHSRKMPAKHKETTSKSNTVPDSSAEQIQQNSKRSRTKRSKSPLVKKMRSQDTRKQEPLLKETDVNKPSDSSDINFSTPKSTQRSGSRLTSEKKSSTQKSPKKSLQRRSNISSAVQGSVLSPGNMSTPQRSKLKDTPAVMSPVFNKRNAKGETPLQVAAIKVESTLFLTLSPLSF